MLLSQSWKLTHRTPLASSITQVFCDSMQNFGDRCAMCGLEVAKAKVADLGQDIDPEDVAMIK